MINYKIIFFVLSLFCLIACNCSNKTKSSTQKAINIPNSKYKALQLFKNDSVLYFKTNFILNKTNYLNKNINYLLDDLELPVNLYYPGIDGVPPNLYYSTIYLQFTNDLIVKESLEKRKQSPLILIIYFENPISTERMKKIRSITKGNWGKDAIEIFGKEKIKDIEMITKGF